MKNLKKVFAFLVAFTMVIGMTMTAAAHTIEIKGNDDSGLTTNHEYSVYQLFVGELSDGKLVDVKYGSAGLGEEGAAVSPEILDAIEKEDDARAYAERILNDKNKPLRIYNTLNSKNEYKLENVPSGYYLIVDEKGKTLEDGDSYSAYIVQVVKDVEMAPKSEKVTSDKKEYNDKVELTNVNEVGVGAVVSYKLTATIAENADLYDYYNFILADTLSGGLTFNNDVTVTIGGEAAEKDKDYALYVGEDGYTFEIALLDAKAHAGEEVLATYSATLNSSAVAMIPETNTYKVIYSNHPEEKYDGKQDDKKPGKPKDITDKVYGKTPEKDTKTYTTKLTLQKVDEKGTALAGATFRLVSKNANQTVVDLKEYFELDPNGTYYLLKDGSYTETAPEDATYIKVGTGDNNTTSGYLKKDDGTYYVPTDVKEYAGKDLYIYSLGTNSDYASVNKYAKRTASTSNHYDAPVDTVLSTGSNGVLVFDQLGTGDYTLTEIDAPDGYNYVKPVTFTITFNEAQKTFEISNVTNATITNNNGVFETELEDRSGATLPETGGMGTTLFYAMGGFLVLAAGVLLITRKRMAA